MSSARQGSRFSRSASFRSGLWPQHASAPSSDTPLSGAPPLSGTPPSPSARQARLISPSHSLPEFLPVLDEASTLKAPLVLPSSAYMGSAASGARPVPQLPPLPSGRRSTYDLRRCASFHSGTSSQPAFPGSGSSSSQGGARQGAGPGGALAEWVPHLMVFSLLCLVMTAATVAFTVSVVDDYDRTATGTFFQISDVHWDPLYRYHGSPKSFCRRSLLAESDKPFGQYGCDSPLLLLKTALVEMAAAESRPDFILVTGDSVAHNLSANLTLIALAKVDEGIAEAFSSEFTKRLHVLGERELAVLDNADRNFSSWLSSLASVWNSTLMEASDDAYDTFLRGGYYMAVLPSQETGGPAMEAAGSQVSSHTSNVAALVLNTVLYSTKDLVLHSQVGPADDPTGQLAWLNDQLDQARHWGRKVVIAGHVPPGVDTVRGEPMWQQQYEQRYMDIVLQHSDVVVGQLFGFLHRDHFTLMRADNHVIFPDAATGGDSLQGHLRKGSALVAEIPRQSAENTVVPGQRAPLQLQRRVAQVPRWWSRIARAVQNTLGLAQDAQKEKIDGPVRNVPGRRRARARLGRAQRLSSRLLNPGWFQQDPPEVLDGDSSAAVLIAPSLSPILLNRPAFRIFSYDRVGLLLDYVQHTADLKLQGAEKMWEIQYGARSVYGLEALDGSNFAELTSSFFNSSGYPTEVFGAFCELRAAGNNAQLSGPYDCCNDCPNFMRCAVEYSTFKQFQGCNDSSIDRARSQTFVMAS